MDTMTGKTTAKTTDAITGVVDAYYEESAMDVAKAKVEP